MATFSPLYTGENSAVKLPELDSIERSLRRNSDLQIQGEEMKLNKALKDKESFQKMLAIDPVTAISTKNATDQAIALEAYNNKWAKKYTQNKGQLSFADEIEMQKDRSMLEAQQKQTLAQQQQYLSTKEIIQRDTRGYYDRQNFDNAEQEYFKTGILPTNMLDVAPQDIRPLLAKDPNQSAYTEPVRLPVKDTMGNTVGYQNGSNEYKRSKQEASEAIFEKLQHEPVLKSVIRDFQSQPGRVQYEALKSYDANSDHKLDPAEKANAYQHMDIRDNPIVKWAMNNPDYISSSMGANPATPRNIPTGKTSTFNYGGVSATNNQNGKFNTQTNFPQATTEGKFVFPDYKNLGQVSQTGESQNIPEIVVNKDGVETTQPLNETMPFHLIGYSPTKDQLVIGVDGKSSDYTYDKGDVLVVPASRFDDLLKKKPFGIFRGQQTTKQAVTKKPKPY